MTTQLEEALKSVKEAIKGEENVLICNRITLHCDKEALEGNKDEIKCDGYMLRGGENVLR